MCAHSECRGALTALGVRDALRRLNGVQDATLQKYLVRIETKLGASGLGAAGVAAVR